VSKKFKRYQSNKLKRLNPESWRKPRGLHNKVRLSVRGHPDRVKVGYGTAASEKILQIVISCENDLLKVPKGKKVQILFSSTLGMKKKCALANKAKEMKIDVENIDDDYSSKVDEMLKARKKAKEDRKSRKLAKKEKKEQKEKQEKPKADDKKEKPAEEQND